MLLSAKYPCRRQALDSEKREERREKRRKDGLCPSYPVHACYLLSEWLSDAGGREKIIVPIVPIATKRGSFTRPGFYKILKAFPQNFKGLPAKFQRPFRKTPLSPSKNENTEVSEVKSTMNIFTTDVRRY